MELGVRSYGNTLLTENLFKVPNLPDKIPAIKAFAYKILEPDFKCIEDDCSTTIGRLLQVPEADLVGLIELESNQYVVEQDIFDWILEDRYTVRVRDTSACVTKDGFCRRCGTGYNARVGIVGSPELGEFKKFESSPRAFQNYLAGTYSGAVTGWQKVAAAPLPGVPDDWSVLTSHGEMDRLCNLLKPLGIAQDDLEYLYGVEDILERALLIIATYGVYSNA